jgi:hypothetical protein
LRGFFERGADLLEAGGGGTHDIRQTTHRIGDDEQQQRIFTEHEPVEGLAFTRHGEITEGHDDAGHGQRQHGHRIQHLPPPDAGAHGNIGHADAEDERHEHRQRGVFQTVGDGRQREFMAERVVVVRKVSECG